MSAGSVIKLNQSHSFTRKRFVRETTHDATLGMIDSNLSGLRRALISRRDGPSLRDDDEARTDKCFRRVSRGLLTFTPFYPMTAMADNSPAIRCF
jgi:hypothetical protein